MRKKIVIFSTLLFIIDQLSKLLVDHFLVLNQSYRICEAFFYITKVYNEGIAFSMLSGKRIMITLIVSLIAGFLWFYIKKFKNNKLNILAFSLVFGGLLGNLVDRLIRGYVVDFLDFYIFNYNFPVFNLADSFIFLGIGILMWKIYEGDGNEDTRTK